jgi:ubiquinone/menaquinone biosynthesis C-methylase UbiE
MPILCTYTALQAGRGLTRATGLDRSRYLVRLERKRARELGLEVTFREGDARQIRLGDGVFHCVTLMVMLAMAVGRINEKRDLVIRSLAAAA